MPTYEYTCDACKKEFEREQRIVDSPIKKCPNCGKMKARRLVSAGNFILKGKDWYSDGYGLHAGAAKSCSSGSCKISKESGSSAAKECAATKGGSAAPCESGCKAETSEKPAASQESAKSSASSTSTTAPAA